MNTQSNSDLYAIVLGFLGCYLLMAYGSDILNSIRTWISSKKK